MGTTPPPDDLVTVPPPFQNPAGSSDDSKARQEADGYAAKNLDDEAEENEHNRRESLRNHAKVAAVGVFWLLVILILSSGMVFAWHCLAPRPYLWLSDDQVGKVQTFLFSGALLGVGSGYLKRYF